MSYLKALESKRRDWIASLKTGDWVLKHSWGFWNACCVETIFVENGDLRIIVNGDSYNADGERTIDYWTEKLFPFPAFMEAASKAAAEKAADTMNRLNSWIAEWLPKE